MNSLSTSADGNIAAIKGAHLARRDDATCEQDGSPAAPATALCLDQEQHRRGSVMAGGRKVLSPS
jgi:hypothetical protein